MVATQEAKTDITQVSLKILSCIYRMREKYGAWLVAGTLRGNKNEQIAEYGLDKLSTYGIVQDFNKEQIVAVIYYLMRVGFLRRSTEYNNLIITNEGKRYIKKRDKLTMPAKYWPRNKRARIDKLLPTQAETLKFWESGKLIEEIASIRGLKISTIENHVVSLIKQQKITDIRSVVNPKIARKILSIKIDNPKEGLKKIKEMLPETITYGQIKMVLAKK